MLVSVTSKRLENFPNEFRLTHPSETSFEETLAEDDTVKNQYDLFLRYIDRLPPRERDLLFLHYIQGRKQTELGLMFGRTQAAISYRLKKAFTRIKFLQSIPEVTVVDIQRNLSPHFAPADMEIFLGMFRHTCQTAVAKEIGNNQCFVRHRFLKNIAALKKLSESYAHLSPYYDLFYKISKNTNILREVRLSRWDKGDYLVDTHQVSELRIST